MQTVEHRLSHVVAGWALWSMPRRARAFILVVDLVFASLLGTGLATTSFTAADLSAFAVFIGGALVSIEGSLRFSWRRPEGGGGANNLLAVWTVPVALLLPPVYSAMVFLPLLAFTQVRVLRRPPVKLLFTAASTGIAGFAGAAVHGWVMAGQAPWHPESLVGSPRALTATLLCVALRYAINRLLVGEVVALTKPGARTLAMFRDSATSGLTAAEACTAVLVALAYLSSPYAILLAIPPVLVLQRTLLVAELRQAARTDPKTGLANSGYWREVAEREIARARSGGEPLVVLLVDVDHFKTVNDRFGHLIGDDVLRAVSAGLTHGLRPRDFVGRFGGEEFVILLAGTDLDQGRHTAERIRAHIAELGVAPANRQEEIRVTISVGVAGFRENGHSVHELLDAADTALYAAKHAGRNCVRVARGARQQVLDLTGGAARLIDLQSRAPVD